jgi:phage terminase large subunit GpA-like protein
MVAGAQVGKTLALQTTIAYDSACDPGPGLIVYPDAVVAERRSKGHIRPMLQDSLPDLMTGSVGDMGIREYKLTSCDWYIGWAGSPSVLASLPIKHLKLDETGKFPAQQGSEADAIRNAEERITSYRPFATIFSVTTPSEPELPGWAEWDASTRCQYQLQCPACGLWSVLYFAADIDRKWFVTEGGEWRGGIKWDRDPNLSRAQRLASAYYECEGCGHHWTTREKNTAVGGGRWLAGVPDAARYCCHLPQWYALTVSFSDVIAKWWDAYQDDDGRRRFLNSVCAVPWEAQGREIGEGALRAHVLAGHHAGTVPDEATCLLLAVDVHDDHLRYRVRAWAPTLTTWGVETGRLLPGLHAVDAMMQRTWTRSTGAVIGIHGGIIDARWRTDEVYQLCLRHPGRLFPVFGQGTSHELFKPVRTWVPGNPAEGLPLSGHVLRLDINDDRWKDRLFSRLDLPLDKRGAWLIECDADDQYFWEMQGEIKTTKERKGKAPVIEWVLRHDNHALDVEKYQLLAAELFQVSAMQQQPTGGPSPHEAETINPYTGKPV